MSAALQGAAVAVLKMASGCSMSPGGCLPSGFHTHPSAPASSSLLPPTLSWIATLLSSGCLRGTEGPDSASKNLEPTAFPGILPWPLGKLSPATLYIMALAESSWVLAW